MLHDKTEGGEQYEKLMVENNLISTVNLCSEKERKEISLPASPVATGDFDGLIPQTKLQDPQLKYETIEISVFNKFSECQAPLHKRKVPIEDFLETVLLPVIFT